MSKVKKQHYVPRSYLKRFTQDGDQLYVFDKFAKTSFKSNIRKVASERYFYDIPQDIVAKDEDLQIIEKGVSKIESDFSNAVDNVLTTVHEEGRIDGDQKSAMAFFITIQFLRTREFRSFLMEFSEKAAKAVLDKLLKFRWPDRSPDEYQVQFNEKMAPLEQAKFMFKPAYLNKLVQDLSNHIWFVGINETTQPLYTSDSPVVRKGHKIHPIVSYEGLASEGIEIAFPITPKHILVLSERTFFADYVKWDCSSVTLKAEGIKYYNSLQVFQSYRQIYCPSDKFTLAKRICNEHPELSTPDRTRVEVL